MASSGALFPATMGPRRSPKPRRPSRGCGERVVLSLLLVLFHFVSVSSVAAFQPRIIGGGSTTSTGTRSRHAKARSSLPWRFLDDYDSQPIKRRPTRRRRSTASLHARIGGSLVDANNENINANDDDEEEDYRIKLQRAEAAIAEAEQARQKLLASNNNKNDDQKRLLLRPPPNSLARVEYSDAGTLQITIPPRGMQSDSLFAGAFSVAWFSAIVPATLAAGAGATLLFMLPFWAAGGMVAKNAVFDPFVSGTLTVGEYAWQVENKFTGRTLTQLEGPTDELRGATAEIVAVVNGKPQAELKLYTDKGISAFGLGLALEELEYLAGEINQQLGTFRSKPSSSS